MLIEVVAPLTVRLPTGQETWTPGRIVDLPEDKARRLLDRVPQYVRFVRPVYWQSMDGVINGPAVLDQLHLATDAAGVERCWFCLSYRGRLVGVREDLLRKVEGE